MPRRAAPATRTAASTVARRGTSRPRRPANLDDRAGQRVDLERLPHLEVLQHRRLVLADRERAPQQPLDRHWKLDAERGGDGGALLEHLAQQRDHLRQPAELRERRARETDIGLNAALPKSFSQIWSR